MVNMDNYEQQSIFGFPEYKITKKIRLIEMFGGIGSQAMALRDIGADFETYKLVEFDRYCVQSYNAVHNTSFVPLDIRDVHGKDLEICEKDKYAYILTYSFPCTDLSVAGKMKGMNKADWENGKPTRSGLLWEVERILKELPKEQLPDVLLMENVTQVHNDQNGNDFMSWQDFLISLGYFNFIADLNAKDYGIPQNRDRCFMVSILSDDFAAYEFPEPQQLTTVMKDYLEEEVDEKYYLNSPKAKELIDKLIAGSTLPQEKGGGMSCPVSRKRSCKGGFKMKIGLRVNKGDKEYKRVIDAEVEIGIGGGQIASTLTTSAPGMHNHHSNMVLEIDEMKIKNNTKQGYIDNENEWRIRKLTPKEYWRLMGYTDEDFEKAKGAGVSNSQLYKQAGNAIVKQVLMAIFKQML